MKTVFAGCLAVLVLGTALRLLSLPEARTDKPILYWSTDNNPARTEQVRIFQEWLDRQREELGPEAVPDFILEIDTANSDLTKTIIQGIAHVGADLPQIYPGSGQAHYLDRIGILADITEAAKEMGFGPDATFPAIAPDLMSLDGTRQLCFPANVTADALWVNETTFKELGLEPPPRGWTVDEFERRGKEFVRRANQGRERIDRFFCAGLSTAVLLRSNGVDVFDETLSGSGYDRPEFIEAVTRYRKWIHEDRLLPSEADKSSANVDAGYGGLDLQLFVSGRAGMFHLGRYALIGLRAVPEDRRPELHVSEVPHFRFPNTGVIARAVGVYKGTKYQREALFFLKFLASGEYNRNIVLDADSLPPNPAHARGDEFFSPPDYPNEHKAHREWLRLAGDIAIANTHSPFVLKNEADRAAGACMSAIVAEPPLHTPARAREIVKSGMDNLIGWTLREYPHLRADYEKARADQQKIDALRAAGEKIPASLITNHFHLRYYKAIGQLDEGK